MARHSVRARSSRSREASHRSTRYPGSSRSRNATVLVGSHGSRAMNDASDAPGGQSTRRRFFAQVATAAAACRFLASTSGFGQERFDQTAADESLKGRLIFYARAMYDDENAGLYAYDFEMRTFEQRLKNVNPDFFCRASPDGKSFAVSEFSRDNEPASIVRPDGRTNVGRGRVRLFWAPDGRRLIVSESTEPPVASKTWRMAADGTGRIPLGVPGDELVTDWSPDGRWLLIVRRRDDPPARPGSGNK